MPSQGSFPTLTPPPTRDIHRPQHLEKENPNPAVSIRGSVSPSVVSGSCIPSLGACGILPPRPPPKDPPRPSEGKAIYSDRTLDRRSNLSGDISIITLPSFVEHERHDPTPATVPTPQNPSAVTPYSEWNDPPSLPAPVLHRQPHQTHQTHPLSSWQTGARYELATAKLKPAVRGAVKNLQPGISSPDALSPLKITAHTLPLLGDRVDGQPHSYNFRDSPQPVPLQQSPTELDETPRSLSTSDATNSIPLPILGFPNPPTSYPTPDQRYSRVTMQTRSSVSTTPSPSAFPSPPGFPLGPRDEELSTISSYSTSGRTFSSAMLWEGNSVRSIEMALPDGGQASILHLGADLPRRMPTIDPRPVPSRHPHPEFIGRGETLVRLRGSSRVSFMRRLSRIPSGPRQMSDRPKSQRRRAPQPLSL